MMLRKSHWTTVIGLVAGFGLILSVAAEARGLRPSAFAGRGPERGGEVRPPMHPHGLLEQLIFPCKAACSNEARSCNEAADSAALTCISDACSAEIAAAQTACAAGASYTASGCYDAINALQACGDSCLTQHQSDVATCFATLGDCLDACAAQ